MKKLFFMLILLVCGWATQVVAQPHSLTFEEAQIEMTKDPKLYAIAIEAPWCQYCQMMKNSTFKNKAVAEKLDKDFYFIPFDATKSETIYFANQKFEYKPYGKNLGVHELALALQQDRNPSYPYFVIINENMEILYDNNSYMTSAAMLEVLSELSK